MTKQRNRTKVTPENRQTWRTDLLRFVCKDPCRTLREHAAAGYEVNLASASTGELLAGWCYGPLTRADNHIFEGILLGEPDAIPVIKVPMGFIAFDNAAPGNDYMHPELRALHFLSVTWGIQDIFPVELDPGKPYRGGRAWAHVPDAELYGENFHAADYTVDASINNPGTLSHMLMGLELNVLMPGTVVAADPHPRFDLRDPSAPKYVEEFDQRVSFWQRLSLDGNHCMLERPDQVESPLAEDMLRADLERISAEVPRELKRSVKQRMSRLISMMNERHCNARQTIAREIAKRGAEATLRFMPAPVAKSSDEVVKDIVNAQHLWRHARELKGERPRSRFAELLNISVYRE